MHRVTILLSVLCKLLNTAGWFHQHSTMLVYRKITRYDIIEFMENKIHQFYHLCVVLCITILSKKINCQSTIIIIVMHDEFNDM